MKKFAMICTIITVALMIACACAMPAAAEGGRFAVVIGTEQEGILWRVDCLADDGDLWAFLADRDEWAVGDVVLLTLENDEVIEVYMMGYLELPAVIHYMENI